MSINQIILTEQNICDIVDYVNSYREKNQAPPLAWDNTIASFAQSWSYNMAINNLFQHSGSRLYGENIGYFNGYGTDMMELIKLAIDNWYNEIALYNFDNPGFSDATGHFTCLVWVASTTFGIGISINETTGESYIVLNTYPAGNILGEFQLNVLPLVPIDSNPEPISVPPQPIITKNKQAILEQLSSIINEVEQICNPTNIIDNINAIIYEIQNSSSF